MPPQSSRDHGPPMSTMRTSSPYFSPNRACAPRAFASSMGRMRVETSRSVRIAVFTTSSISERVSGESGCDHEKSSRM